MIILCFIYLANANYVVTNQTIIGNQIIYQLSNQNIVYSTSINHPIAIITQSNNVFDIKVIDPNNPRFQITDIPMFNQTYNDNEYQQNQSQIYYIQVNLNPFIVQVYRNITNELIWDFKINTFRDNLLEFQSKPTTEYFFGLGERNPNGLRFKPGKYTLMSRDEPHIIEDGLHPGKNVYSSQPMYLMKEQNDNHGFVFFFQNSNPIDVTYIKHDSIQFHTIGGIIHTKLFIGNDIGDSLRKYHHYIGQYIVPPFWAMGFHQSKWGYLNIDELIDVVNNHKTNNIPIDSIWSDIDYMDQKQTFTVNSKDFPIQQIQTIQQQQVKFIPIVDVAIGVNDQNNSVLQKGIELDIFCISPSTGERFKGSVWPGNSYFPDFLHPNISLFWEEQLLNLYEKTKFNGIWLDMNEPANFCKGECKWKDILPQKIREEYKNKEFFFPYKIGNQDISSKTLPPHLIHYGGYTHKDTHNLYGILDMYHTYQTLHKTMKMHQPFILSRSTFPGAQKYGFHWTGDNFSNFDFLKLSVSAIALFNIFGMPMTGSDVCGFMGNTNIELCQRWIQLSTFYPFMRNHNHIDGKNQEFYQLGNEVLQTAQISIQTRYSLIKQIYTEFFTHNRTGAVFQPLFLVFANDSLVYSDNVLDNQFMIGDYLLITPCLKQSQQMITAYFPKSSWYNLKSGREVQNNSFSGSHLVQTMANDQIPIFLRGGKLIIKQFNKKLKNIMELDNIYTLVAAIEDNISHGQFLDINFSDEEQIVNKCYQKDCIQKINLQFENKQILILTSRQWETEVKLKEIILLGKQIFSDDCNYLTNKCIIKQEFEHEITIEQEMKIQL